MASWIDSDVRLVDKRKPVSSVLGWLRGEESRRPVVCDGKRPYAILNQKAMMLRRLLDDAHVDGFALPVPVLDEKDGIDEARIRLAREGLPYLPVWDGKNVLGVVTAAGALVDVDASARAEELATVTSPLTEDQSIDDALHAFRKTGLAHLPVVDARGRLVASLPRTAVFRFEDFAGEPKNRRDRAGGYPDLHEVKVQGFAEGGWTTMAPDAPFDACVEALQGEAPVYVASSDGKYRGVLDAVFALRALQAVRAY